MNERSNRTRKAQAIAAALAATDCTANDAAELDDAGWHIACLVAAELAGAGWTDASPATRRQVVEMLAADERLQATEAAELRRHETDDVFARIAAPHVGPQDPDAPTPSTATAESPVVRQVGSEWRVYSGGSFVGFGDEGDAEQYVADIADDTPPMHCTEFVAGDPAGCARCGEAKNLHPAPAVADRHPAARHTLACLAGGGHCQPGQPC